MADRPPLPPSPAPRAGHDDADPREVRLDGRARVTRNDVARRAGTSTAVVSYVVNNGPRAVSEATRGKVLAAIAELGYEPNRLAQALRSARSGLLGLIVPSSTTPFFAELRASLEEAAFERGYLLLTGSTGFDLARERKYLEVFDGLQVEGLLVVASGPDRHDTADRVARTPVVYVHRAPRPGTRALVRVDNEHIGHLATRHLIGHGHRAVGCLGTDEVGPVNERIRGWRRAAAEAGTDARLLRYCASDRGAAERVAVEWLTSPAPPTALFAATDEHAIGVLSAAHRVGRAVPDALAVVGADGIREAAYTVPPLSTVRIPTRRLADAALDRLLGADDVEPLDLSENVALVARASCGCDRPRTGAPADLPTRTPPP